MRKISILLLLLLALPVGMLADEMHESLPSNYSNWLNLSNGYSSDKSTSPPKMEVAIDGNTIHLAWVEFAKQADGSYNVWYRRSSDLGKSWEDARVITKLRDSQILNINSESCNRFMVADNGYVHMAFVQNKQNDDQRSYIQYLRSDNDGVSFSSQSVGEISESYRSYTGSMIACDGKFVVIASPYNNDSKLFYFTSKDNGQTFTTQMQTLEHNASRSACLYDLQASNGKWVSMTYGYNWNYSLKYGYLYMTVSDGETMTTQNIAPLKKVEGEDDTPFAYPDVMEGGNGNSYNYHPQVVMEGNIIHVMYKGDPCDSEDSDYKHTLYQKSTNGGKTWSKAFVLPESNGGCGTIAAKGNNVYVLTAIGSRRVIFYSHDGGESWDVQKQCTWSDKNPSSSFSLVIDPTDPTGKHAYLTANRFYYVETTDGFKTINKNFVLGDESLYGSSNYALTLLPDKEGTEHWFLQYRKPFVTAYGNGNVDDSSNDICYRRVEPEPDPSGTKALKITDKEMIDYRVVVPMTPSLALKEAMTVEAWVRFDSLCTFQIAGTSQEPSHSTSQYNGGWYIQTQNWYGNYGFFEAGLRTDLSDDDIGVRIYNTDALRIYNFEKWHHVVFTYDANGGENNARLYIDGMLASAKTVVGNIQLGSNPITIGATSSYASKGLLDNFAMYNRALTYEEIREHLYNMPKGNEDGCVCLLNFDGTLKDMSGNGNDGVALLDVDFVDYEGIRVPEANINMAKDVTGMYVALSSASPNAEASWWVKPNKWYYTHGYNSEYEGEKNSSVKIDFSPSGSTSFAGNYTAWMVASGTGDYNAYTTASAQFSIGGLSKVTPAVSGQDVGVRLTIRGGYSLKYSSQPQVLLHKNGEVIKGKWMIDNNYNSSQVQSADDLAKALFDLSNAELGVYDVVVGNDTLYHAFTVERSEEPDVWMNVSGSSKQLWNKWKSFTITYGNNSNAPAYNVPLILMISNRKGTVDVKFDFDYDLCNPALSDVGLETARKLGDHLMAYDEYLDDSVRVYSFMIPYIAPNSTANKSFRIRHNQSSDGAGKEGEYKPAYNANKDYLDIIFWAEDPWGPYDPDAPNPYDQARTRAPYTMEQGECVAKELGKALAETAIGFVPGVGCMYAVGKTAYQAAAENENRGGTLFQNTISTLFSCAENLIPGGALFEAAFTLGSLAWNFYCTGDNIGKCLNGNAKSTKVKSVGSYDPNEMIGPYGYDDEAHYIQPIGNMAYTITYENKSSATAPAHEVYVSDKLDLSKFEPETFGFTSFGWADTTIVVGGSYTKDFTRDIKYKVNDVDIIVRVSGSFDQETGEANWSMISLDKNGNEIEDPDLGFLLPNNDDHVGEGFVSFSINHKPTPANGSTISNKAVIVFDANAPIETNTFVNTFDTDYPTSRLTGIEQNGSMMTVKFDGEDATSGIHSYNLYVFKNGGEPELLAAGITENQYQFKTEANTEYGFCVLARDNAGRIEPKDVSPGSLSGDVNGDGVFDGKDIVAIVHYIVTGDENGIVFKNADVNGDKKVNIADIIVIMNRVNKK